MKNFVNVESVGMQANGFEVVPGFISWPSSLKHINLNGNVHIKKIEEKAFSSAINLETLSLVPMGENATIESNGFHTTSSYPNKKLTYAFTSGYETLQANAFGNVDGGQLWNTLDIVATNFPQDVFRLLLKTHFDKGHSTLFEDSLLMLQNCDSCDIAWLYKDAHMFGVETYRSLIGLGTIILRIS